MNIPELMERIKRILIISNNPDKDEFNQSAKITGLGLILIGVVGFIVFMIAQLLIQAGFIL